MSVQKHSSRKCQNRDSPNCFTDFCFLLMFNIELLQEIDRFGDLVDSFDHLRLLDSHLNRQFVPERLVSSLYPAAYREGKKKKKQQKF